MTSVPQPLRVLIVEDDKMLCDLTRDQLRHFSEWDIEPSVAYTMADAVRAPHPHIVLLDLSLPDSDGLRSVNTILDAHPDAAVVVFSGYNAHELIRRAYEMGVQGFIVKGTHAAGADGLVDVLARAVVTKHGEVRRLSAAIAEASDAERAALADVVARLDREIMLLHIRLRHMRATHPNGAAQALPPADSVTDSS